MRNIRFPDLDITGMWVLAVGVFFHLIARLVRKQPELAVQAGEIFGLGMVVFGGYRILNALIAEAEHIAGVPQTDHIAMDELHEVVLDLAQHAADHRAQGFLHDRVVGDQAVRRRLAHDWDRWNRSPAWSSALVEPGPGPRLHLERRGL